MARPKVNPMENGPFVVKGLDSLIRFRDGKPFEGGESVALCRCGGSKNKPYCDGTHASNGFSSAKDPNHLEDKRDDYVAESVTVHDNRAVCAHAGRCTDGLSAVFRLRQEPFVDASAAPAEDVIRTVRTCPSGALSYSVDGEEQRERRGEPSVGFAPNGPYVFQGGAELNAQLGKGATEDHFTLCRCGGSTNKPFCSGAHWNVQFDEDASSAKS